MCWTEAVPTRLISCENEAPFSRLIRENGIDCLLFTSGFPNSAVQKLYALLAPQARDCLHWGDDELACTLASGWMEQEIWQPVYSVNLKRIMWQNRSAPRSNHPSRG